MATFTNQAKNTSSFATQAKSTASSAALLTEAGGYLLQETGFKLILEQYTPFYSNFTNLPKH